MASHPTGAVSASRPFVPGDDATLALPGAPQTPRPGGAPDPAEAGRRPVPLRLPDVEEARLVSPPLRTAEGDDGRALRDRAPLPPGQDQHRLLLRARRSGICGGLRVRRALRLPRPGDGVTGVAGEPLHRARDANFHLRPDGAGGCPAARPRTEPIRAGRGRRPSATGQPDRGRMKTVEAGEVGRPAADRLAPALVRAARRELVDRRPVWFMRQAGRSLPEYRKIRETYDLFAICQNPELCAEVTLQPVRRLGVDGAVLFADIMLPVAFGLAVELQLVDGVGPVVERPIRSMADIDRLQARSPGEAVPFVLETIKLLRRELDSSVAMIGFAGAPFTLAGYLIEGKPSREFLITKTMMYTEPALWDALMTRLSRLVLDYLLAQIDAGAQLVQLFDSWVGCLSPADYRRYVQPHVAGIFKGLRRVDSPSIHFGTGTAGVLPLMREAGGDVIGVDWRVDLGEAWRVIGYDHGIQGNLDPAVLLAPWPLIEDGARRVIEAAGGRPGHIFNLGHGVLPASPVEHLQRLVEFVHAA